MQTSLGESFAFPEVSTNWCRKKDLTVRERCSKQCQVCGNRESHLWARGTHTCTNTWTNRFDSLWSWEKRNGRLLAFNQLKMKNLNSPAHVSWCFRTVQSRFMLDKTDRLTSDIDWLVKQQEDEVGICWRHYKNYRAIICHVKIRIYSSVMIPFANNIGSLTNNNHATAAWYLWRHIFLLYSKQEFALN